MKSRAQGSFGIVSLLGLGLSVASCGHISAPALNTSLQTNALSPLEAQLNSELATVAPNHRPDYFKLPDSTDFANIPQDTQNPITAEKIELGKKLFHEPALLAAPLNRLGLQASSCASCHVAAAGFQSGLRQGIGEGGVGYGTFGDARTKNSQYAESDMDTPAIRPPSILNLAYQANLSWNGQFGAKGVNSGTQGRWFEGTPLEFNYLGYEGPETQAIGGQDIHRMDIDNSGIATNPDYQKLFAAAFPHPTTPSGAITQVNAGMAMAAYERTVLSNQAPFQQFVRGTTGVMSASELRGANLFFGKAQCYQCHSGPALDSMSFHGLGMNDLVGAGVFNSNPAAPEHLGRGGFTGNTNDNYHFKTPQLYNLADVKFLGHGGTFHSVKEVIVYKNLAQAQNANVPHSALDPLFQPLGLSNDEVSDLSNFINTSLHDAQLTRFLPLKLPTNLCFPNADTQSIFDLGCAH